MPSRFRRCVAAIAVWPALIGIATGAARGQTVEPAVEPSVAPSDAPPVQPTGPAVRRQSGFGRAAPRAPAAPSRSPRARRSPVRRRRPLPRRLAAGGDHRRPVRRGLRRSGLPGLVRRPRDSRRGSAPRERQERATSASLAVPLTLVQVGRHRDVRRRPDRPQGPRRAREVELADHPHRLAGRGGAGVRRDLLRTPAARQRPASRPFRRFTTLNRSPVR